MIFLDTNILVYASGLHGDDEPRTEIARKVLLEQAPFALSVQVLHEFYDRVTRPKQAMPFTDELAFSSVAEFRQFTVLPLTLALFDAALEIREQFKFRYYDCAIIAAALELGCDTLYTEDMKDGQRIDFLTIVNPFAQLRGN